MSVMKRKQARRDLPPVQEEPSGFEELFHVHCPNCGGEGCDDCGNTGVIENDEWSGWRDTDGINSNPHAGDCTLDPNW